MASYQLLPLQKTITTALKSRSYATKAFAADSLKHRRKQERKSFWHALVFPRFADKWFSLLESPAGNELLAKRPRVYLKPFRVYQSANWPKAQRVKVILDSYRFLNLHKLDFLLGSNETSIAQFLMKDGSMGELVWGYDERFRKEGEFTIQFRSETLGGELSTIAFSFEEVNGQWGCRIGCLQGVMTPDGQLVKRAQQAMFGLRPKVLLLLALQQICQQLGIRKLYGAGDSIQAYRKKHAIHLPYFHKINFDYDTLWQEEGGIPAGKGWFELPLVPKRKTMEEVKSHKRATYRKRYALEDAVAANLQEIFKKPVL